MAFFNEARVFARILKKPIIRLGENGEPLQAEGYLHVVKGSRDYGRHIDKIEYDTPLILSANPDIISEMATWEENDIVDINAYFSTMDIEKATYCKECNNLNIKRGTVSYLNPLFAKRRATGLSKADSITLLRDNAEISNHVKLVGRVCTEPKEVAYKSGHTLTAFNLAVKRKKFFVNEPADWGTDFPWIKAYDDIGKQCLMALKPDSLVMVDGFIQSRSVTQTTTCENCGTEYEWPDVAMEVVPYAVEFLMDFNKLDSEN